MSFVCAAHFGVLSLVLIPHGHGQELDHQSHPECRLLATAIPFPAAEAPSGAVILIDAAAAEAVEAPVVDPIIRRTSLSNSLRAPPIRPFA